MKDIFSGAEHILEAENYVQKKREGWERKLPLSMMSFPMIGEVVKHKISFEDVCEMIHARGIYKIDMMGLELLLYGKKKVRAALKKYGISLECLNVTVPMGIMKAPLIRIMIKKHLKTASSFGCKKLMIIPMPQFLRQPSKEQEKKKRLERCIRYMREAVEEAKKYNIKVCIEDTPTCDVPLCSINDCKSFLEAVPGLGLVFDTANMIPKGDDPLVFYEELKTYICHVHLKDVKYTTTKSFDRCSDGRFIECCLWGEGLVPVKNIYEKLELDGYQGTCALEYASPKQMGVASNDSQIGRFIHYLK